MPGLICWDCGDSAGTGFLHSQHENPRHSADLSVDCWDCWGSLPSHAGGKRVSRCAGAKQKAKIYPALPHTVRLQNVPRSQQSQHQSLKTLIASRLSGCWDRFRSPSTSPSSESIQRPAILGSAATLRQVRCRRGIRGSDRLRMQVCCPIAPARNERWQRSCGCRGARRASVWCSAHADTRSVETAHQRPGHGAAGGSRLHQQGAWTGSRYQDF